MMTVIVPPVVIIFAYGFFLMGLAVWVSHKLTTPPRQKQKKTPGHDGLTFSCVTVTAPGGRRLKGWVTSAVGTSRGVLVLCHNYKASKQKMLPWIRFLSKAGYETVAFDFNGHGESDQAQRLGGLVTRTLIDLRALLTQFDRLPLENRSCVGLMGFSMGSVSIIGYLASARRALNIDAVVIDSGPPSPLVWNSRVDLILAPVFKWLPGIGLVRFIVRRFQRFHYIPDGVRSIPEQVLQTETPFFFIQGLKDTISTPDQSRWLHDHLNRAPKQYWAVPEAHHMTNLCLRPEDYQRRVIAFLDRHMTANKARIAGG